MKNTLTNLIQSAAGTDEVKRLFLDRLAEGRLTQSQNPLSHFCAYFAAYDPAGQNVFIGHHKKSDLWLFNGGHMDPGETPRDTVVREAHEEWNITLNQNLVMNPQLITLTKIEHPERQICEWHFDFWHFMAFTQASFHPTDASLKTEFISYGWKPFADAAALLTDPNSKEALAYCKNRR